MPEASACLYIHIRPSQAGLFRFLLEARENLALATTLERDTAIVKVIFAQESRETVLEALADMRRSVDFRELPVPESRWCGSCGNEN